MLGSILSSLINFLRDGTEVVVAVGAARKAAAGTIERRAIEAGGLTGLTAVFFLIPILHHQLTDRFHSQWEGYAWVLPTLIAAVMFAIMAMHLHPGHGRFGRTRSRVKHAIGGTHSKAIIIFIAMLVVSLTEGLEYGFTTLGSQLTAVMIVLVLGVSIGLILIARILLLVRSVSGEKHFVFVQNAALGALGLAILAYGVREFDTKFWWWVVLISIDAVATTAVLVRGYMRQLRPKNRAVV